MYSYHPAGAVTAKPLQITRQGYDQYSNWVTGVGTMDADYGAYGEKLGVYSMVGPTTDSTSTYSFTPLRTSVWFTGTLIWEGAAAVYRDAVGTNRAGGARFYPYGDEITSTGNDRSKFATYNRDSFTGFDYADQRYYASAYGRFLTVDQSGTGLEALDPGTWNRYAYAYGDPTNLNDPEGRCPPGYVPATAAQLQEIVDTAETYVGKGLQHTPKGAQYHFHTNPNGSLNQIDCTGLLMQALAGIAYTSGTFQQASIANITTSNLGTLFSVTQVAQVGDIVAIPGHAVIVTCVSATGQITSFVGSQSSTGPANVYSTDASWSPSKNFKGWGGLIGAATLYTPCVPAGSQTASTGDPSSSDQNGGGLQPVIDSFLAWVDSIPLGGGGPDAPTPSTLSLQDY
jgi:RHS repeat-associated protein